MSTDPTPTPSQPDTPWWRRATTRRSLATVVAAIGTAATVISGLLADGVFSVSDQFAAAGAVMAVVVIGLGESSTSAARDAVGELAKHVVPAVAEVKEQTAVLSEAVGVPIPATPDPEATLDPTEEVLASIDARREVEARGERESEP